MRNQMGLLHGPRIWSAGLKDGQVKSHLRYGNKVYLSQIWDVNIIVGTIRRAPCEFIADDSSRRMTKVIVH